ncbi:MAG: hypothetical protein ACJ8ER_17215 [Allosphingosinicella sp.]
MKFLVGIAIVTAQIAVSAQPAAAAELLQEGMRPASQVSAFAGARLRVPLGGRERPQAGLALTSTMRSGPTGELRFTKGAELGFSGDSTLRLSLAGRRVSTLAPGPAGPEGRKLGTSTGTGLLIVGGIVLLTAGAVALLLVSQE